MNGTHALRTNDRGQGQGRELREDQDHRGQDLGTEMTREEMMTEEKIVEME